jgi:phosphoserine phosphatase
VSELVLINVSGRDKPGLTSEITGIMGRYDVRILDIGQAVIHDHLTWGILIEIPDESKSSPVIRDLLFRLHALDLQVRFAPITVEEYQSWAAARNRACYIVTLLARDIKAEQIARVSAITARHGLNIDNISRLSARPSLNAADNRIACVEFSVRGTPSDLEQLRADFLHIAGEMNVDIAFQEDSIFRRNRRLVVFDMDSTLIEAEVIDGAVLPITMSVETRVVPLAVPSVGVISHRIVFPRLKAAPVRVAILPAAALFTNHA